MERYKESEGVCMARGTVTQCQRVIDYMQETGSITQLQALQDLGVMRLASRISDIRKMGYAVEVKTETAKNRYGETCHYARYSLCR